MKSLPQYKFYKTKYGEELLIDVVTLDSIRQHIIKHPVHTLSYFDITFITGGEGCFSLDNRQYSLSRGDVLFSRPNEIRSWDKDKLPQGYALIFEEEFLLSFFNDPYFIRNLPCFDSNRLSAKINIAPVYSRMESLIQHIMAEINDEASKDKHILRALLYEALTLLSREYSRNCAVVGEKNGNRYIDDFVRLVEKDFCFYHDTRYYAGQLCITPNYLNEIVRKSIGISPKSYIQDKIIRKAKILLSYTTLSVAEIAGRLNFENSSYFIRLFRKQTHLTPLQYRHRKER